MTRIVTADPIRSMRPQVMEADTKAERLLNKAIIAFGKLVAFFDWPTFYEDFLERQYARRLMDHSNLNTEVHEYMRKVYRKNEHDHNIYEIIPSRYANANTDRLSE